MIKNYTDLTDRVAVVIGGTSGLGRAIALGLAEAGAAVVASGRRQELVDEMAAAIKTLGRESLNCSVNVSDRASIDTLRDAVLQRFGKVDVLVNAAWGGYARMVEDGRFTWQLPFWEQPAHRWTGMLDAGVRAAFVCSALAAGMMVRRRRGLIVNIGYWAARKYMGNVIYGVAKAATDKMTADMAHELRPHGVAAVSLYPGLVRTEAVIAAGKEGWLDLSNSESPEFIGRVVAALAQDPGLMARTGKVAIAADVAAELGVTDVDGRQPAPLTLETA